MNLISNIDPTTVAALTAIAITWTQFEPIQSIVKQLDSLPGKIYKLIAKVLTCTKCFAFWGTLIYTQEFSTACIVSVFATYISNQLGTIKLF